ncbi:MAG: hypothetical protein KBG48_30935 [Kofleriaceae bacterium]|nr:hypothetical protein [Kofleriaceae bacterium]MBP9171849.1 hypothetical protein [Kofleriaceae bacterium]MBP9862898.1 hypothetical protein [Kofleriaceae bacterium]
MTAALVDALAHGCAAAGFDLCASGVVADYNVRVPDNLRLPDFGRPQALVVLVGNTAALWPRFQAALTDPRLAAAAHPLDSYAAATITAAVDAAAGDLRRELRFAPEPPPRRVALQRLAEATGLAAIAPSHLAIHPVYGSWFGLRAAIVLDVDGEPATPAPRPACDCAIGCGPAMARAMAAGPPRDGRELRDRWRLWLAVRDACPVGRGHRYGDDQLTYHYTGDRTRLRPT